jgi:hypothetical protein
VDESNEAEVGFDSAADCMPVDIVASEDVPVGTAEFAVPGPE